MTRTIRLLAIMAAVQLLLIVLAFMGRPGLSSQPARGALLNFDPAQVERLLIAGRNDERVALVKRDGRWQLTAYGGFPADQGRVVRLLEQLRGLQHGLPVATSTGALRRFKVAEQDFERHLQLKRGDATLSELFLGSGAGARQSYARPGDEAAVYAVAIGSYEVPVTAEDWEDKTLLQLAPGDVTAIEAAGMRLQRDGSATATPSGTLWKSDSPETGKVLDRQAIDAWLSSLLSLRYRKVLGTEARPEYGLDEPAFVVALTRPAGVRRYRFGKRKDSDDYVLKLSDRPEYFLVAGRTADPIVAGAAKDKWLKAASEPGKETASGTAVSP